MMTRRQALKKTALATVACAAASQLQNVVAQSKAAAPASAAAPSGPFTLPPLPYAFDALEPHIDSRTMEIHHDKHHAAYVANLNKAIAPYPELVNKTVSQLLEFFNTIPDAIRTAVRNNGGGHYNHSLFWQMMKKNGGGEPKGELAKAIDKKFGSFSAFRDEFTKAALGQFGSGWAWLVKEGTGVRIDATPNQESPLERELPVLLGLDVWEHAYYLKYQNRRADYIAAWFNVVNWDFASERFADSKAWGIPSDSVIR